MSDIANYRLFRRPSAGPYDWTPAGRLAVLIERAGVNADLTEVGWRTEDGAEASLTFPGLVGIHRSPGGEVWALRGEPAPDVAGGSEVPAAYRVFEGDDEKPLSQHPLNPLRLLLEVGAGPLVRLSWRSAAGDSGHAVFAPPVQDGHIARVVEVQATAEHPDGGEVARNLLDGSAATKWFAPVPRAELVLRLGAARTVVRYDLDSADDAPDRDPGDWELLGFSGGRWVVLDRRRGERFRGRLTSRTFAVARPRTCERYRLRIVGNAGSPHLQLGGLRLHLAEGPEPPPSFLGWYRRPAEDAVPLRGFLIRQPVATAPPVSDPAVSKPAVSKPAGPLERALRIGVSEDSDAHEGRRAHPEHADDLLAEGRRLALAGEVTAAHETLNRAMVAGSAAAAYLDAQIRLFAFPADWHPATLSNGVLGNRHVMAAIDDDHLRGDLIPMYLALYLPDRARPTGPLARQLARHNARIGAWPGCPADQQDDAGWEAFAATLVGDPVPDPDPFDRTCAVARELIHLERPDDAWNVLRSALPSWQPDSPLRVMPTVLLADPVLRTIMTPERRLVAAITRAATVGE